MIYEVFCLQISDHTSMLHFYHHIIYFINLSGLIWPRLRAYTTFTERGQLIHHFSKCFDNNQSMIAKFSLLV